MGKTSVWLPDDLLETLDRVSAELDTNRSALIRHALQRYFEDYSDLSLAIERLQDPADKTMNWHEVREKLLNTR